MKMICNKVKECLKPICIGHNKPHEEKPICRVECWVSGNCAHCIPVDSKEPEMMICDLKCEKCHEPPHNIPHVCIAGTHRCVDGHCIPIPVGSKEPETGLLTDYEAAQFTKSEIVHYGDTPVDEQHWDIEGILKAQSAKTAALYQAELAKLREELEALKKQFGK
jgi:hypothetical protein